MSLITSCLEEIHANPEGFLPVLINLEKHDTAEAWLADMLSENLLQQTTGKQLTCFGSNILRDFWLRKTA